jgi:ADP-ribose pyrophosphatase YjhB (NUDIX family)
MEYLDIYTDKFKHIGTCEKGECHKKGYWHKIITVLAINPETRTVYFQRKWPEDKLVTEDNALLNFTVGGHIQAGETLEEAVREVKEELLEDVSLSDLVFLGIRQTAATVTPTYIANEFQYIYLYPTNKTLDDFSVNGDEIARLVEVNLDDALQLFFNEKESINSKEKYLDENQKYLIKNRKITKNNFMECYQIIDEFYKRMLIAAKRYCDKEDTKYLMW